MLSITFSYTSEWFYPRKAQYRCTTIVNWTKFAGEMHFPLLKLQLGVMFLEAKSIYGLTLNKCSRVCLALKTNDTCFGRRLKVCVATCAAAQLQNVLTAFGALTNESPPAVGVRLLIHCPRADKKSTKNTACCGLCHRNRQHCATWEWPQHISMALFWGN